MNGSKSLEKPALVAATPRTLLGELQDVVKQLWEIREQLGYVEGQQQELLRCMGSLVGLELQVLLDEPQFAPPGPGLEGPYGDMVGQLLGVCRSLLVLLEVQRQRVGLTEELARTLGV